MPAILAIIGIFTCGLYLAIRKPKAAYIEPRKWQTAGKIYCGSCSIRVDEQGRIEQLPAPTFKTPQGTCQTCGGSSYVLVEELAPKVQAMLMKQQRRKLIQMETERARQRAEREQRRA